MPEKKVFVGDVRFFSVLDESGAVDSKLEPAFSSDELKKLFEWMIQIRAFDDKCVKLQRSGKLGTYLSVLGQEAQVAAALAMEKNDWLVPYFRDNGLILARGAKFEELLAVGGGSEWGSQFSGPNILPVAIPVATQLLHAVGIAWGMKISKEKNAVLVSFGDGATSEGDFHEAMNFAGVFQLPVVFFCQNNQWAISVPRKNQTASETIAQKALGYGFSGVQVDGNDPLAVFVAVSEALKKARQGKGPTLIEMITYRMSDHSTADDASKYRSLQETRAWEKKDPIDRFRKYLKAKKIWTQAWEDRVGQTIRTRIEESMRKAELIPNHPSTDIVDFVFLESTMELLRQREFLEEAGRREKRDDAK